MKKLQTPLSKLHSINLFFRESQCFFSEAGDVEACRKFAHVDFVVTVDDNCLNHHAHSVVDADFCILVEAVDADVVIGKDAFVTERIDNLHAQGAVMLDGKVWTARMVQEQETAEAGETVRVLRIEGVKLIVEKK